MHIDVLELADVLVEVLGVVRVVVLRAREAEGVHHAAEDVVEGVAARQAKDEYETRRKTMKDEQKTPLVNPRPC